MYNTSHSILIPLVLFMLFGATERRARAQETRFSTDAYEQYLSNHTGISASSLLREYPSPVFRDEGSRQAAHVAYLDSAILKLGLTLDEQDMLLDNGVMVTERLGEYSISNGYYSVWKHDLPVLITTDAILHSVHSSWDLIMKDLEGGYLMRQLDSLCTRLHTTGLPRLQERYGDHPDLAPMLRDVDVYLTIARRLLEARAVKPLYPENEMFISGMLDMIAEEQPLAVSLFSNTPRIVDFSQFKPRGRYAENGFLERYFRTLVWLGRTEFMLTKPLQDGPHQFSDGDVLRQTIDAQLILEALLIDGAGAHLRNIDEMLRFIVGESDNVTAVDLALLGVQTGIMSAADLLDPVKFEQWQKALLDQPFAAQRICTQIMLSDPMNPDRVQPPSAFLLLGQRFLVDSYIMQNVTYDRIGDDRNKTLRMLPSSLDVLFALGNNPAAQFLADEIDRYRYGRHLAGLRFLLDSYADEFWNSSMYNLWLNGIMALSPPDRLDDLPAFMTTAAWWQEKMNTQLASWAQLRHDNLLYGKSSGSMSASCSYPYGYVEPIPEFYVRMKKYGESAAAFFNAKPALRGFAGYFSFFASKMDTLGMIAGKELAQVKLSDEEQRFIKTFLFARESCVPVFDGWFLRLCYNGIDNPDLVIADVHTAPSDEVGSITGSVFHAGTAPYNLGFIIAPSPEGEESLYAGVMLSYSEYVTADFERLTDKEWQLMVWERGWQRPDWTNVYLADRHGNKRTPAPSLNASQAVAQDRPAAIASTLAVYPNYPNPFSAASGTLMQFTVHASAPENISVVVYDAMGRKIKTLLDRTCAKGAYMLRWDGCDAAGSRAAPGMYIVHYRGSSATLSSVILLADVRR